MLTLWQQHVLDYMRMGCTLTKYKYGNIRLDGNFAASTHHIDEYILPQTLKGLLQKKAIEVDFEDDERIIYKLVDTTN